MQVGIDKQSTMYYIIYNKTCGASRRKGCWVAGQMAPDKTRRIFPFGAL